ncbi:fatty-acyl-CoA synthase [Roseiarcus fermentans]|uniref:Fatty-acyl-CoA synthase n=1 Tax=Roseiarcus fermentans TaxID=1473586 RepID=A0A366FGF3_9HYPH|nr:AMP-binding protein [Roseiarcus fermentans]RBP13754.1 fatty-acyl-CoA synthase [Roseiarcus fermentans]
MAYGYTPAERAELDARARVILDACPDVGSFIRRSLSPDPGHETLVYLRTALDPDPVVTRAGAFLGLVEAARLWLRRNGVGPQDVVAILAPNVTAVSIAAWAAMSHAVVQPLNLLFSREAIAAQLAAVDAKVVFVPPPGSPGGLYEKVADLGALAPSLETIVILPMDGRVAFGDEPLAPALPPARPETARPDAVAALLPTGGTTGAPKVVPLTHRNIVASATASMLALDVRADDRIVIALPLFHVGGAFCTSLSALGAGATMILPTAGGFRNPEVVANYWRILDRQRATIGGLVPTGLAAAAEAPAEGCDRSRLRLFATGASVCPPEIERRFLRVWPGDCVRQIYGMTEFAGAITQTPSDRAQRPGSVGLPAALVEVAVLAGDTIHRGASPVGEILARGPQMFAGYLDPRQHGASFHDGWLRSGDLGRIGDDGEVYVTGRAKDVIIRGGHNIDPTAIEDVAMRFPGVGLAAAVGRPDAYAGETPMLFVTPSPGAAIDPEGLARFVAAGVIEGPARPRAIVAIADMPMTPVGKIYKPRLRELAAEAAAGEALAAALCGAAFEVSAGHRDGVLVVTARVPAPLVEDARAALGRFPFGFDTLPL